MEQTDTHIHTQPPPPLPFEKKWMAIKQREKKGPSDISGSSLYGVGHCITPNPDAIVASGEGRGSKKKGWKGRI